MLGWGDDMRVALYSARLEDVLAVYRFLQ